MRVLRLSFGIAAAALLGAASAAGRIGKGRAVCAGDTVYDRRAPALAYGRVWARNGFRCVSHTQGLTCTKAGGNGFFLSRHRWRVF